MFIKCLGSGDAFGSGGRCNTSFYIRTDASGILLDCGASTLIAMKREKLSTDDIDVVVISHLHGDHFGGLAFLLCEITALNTRSKPLTIIGPPDVEARSRQALECFFPGVALKADSAIRFTTYTTEEKLTLDSLQLTPYAAIHSPQTHPHSLRLVADQKVVAYSGDTEWTEDLLRVSKGADLFICEASTYESSIKHHLSVKQVLDQIDRVDAKRIVLTHLSEEALKHTNEIPLTVAADGMVLMDD